MAAIRERLLGAGGAATTGAGFAAENWSCLQNRYSVNKRQEKQNAYYDTL